MKILKRQINGRGAGTVKLEAEEDDDMYHLYNLIAKGDTLEAFTVRNVDFIF
jgi:protein pelota